MTATVQHNQSLLDVAVQHCGTFEAAFDAALINHLSFTDTLQTGQQIALPAVTDRQTVAHFAAANHSPATAISQPDDNPQQLEGIDFWAIETQFTVT